MTECLYVYFTCVHTCMYTQISYVIRTSPVNMHELRRVIYRVYVYANRQKCYIKCLLV